MRILDFASVNRDHVYHVPTIVKPGQTISASQKQIYWGGKGLNQCIAAARGGGDVVLACRIHQADESALLELLHACGAHPTFVSPTELPTGQAIIQVDANGQNSIIVYAGANHSYTKEFVEHALNTCSPGDFVLLTNEVNEVNTIIELAYQKELKIVWNPSPFDTSLCQIDLTKVSMFLLNEDECHSFTGIADPFESASALCERAQGATIVETLGSKGVLCIHNGKTYRHGVYDVEVVDTTAAGDTFTGYFLAACARNDNIDKALMLASRAASLAVSVKGAVNSIPYLADVKQAMMRIKG